MSNKILQNRFAPVLALAQAEGLTAYDAAYLDLAMRRGTESATLNKELVRAARRGGVATLPA